MEKNKYSSPELEIIKFDADDVIVTSDCGGLEPDETTFAGGDG